MKRPYVPGLVTTAEAATMLGFRGKTAGDEFLRFVAASLKDGDRTLTDARRYVGSRALWVADVVDAYAVERTARVRTTRNGLDAVNAGRRAS